MNKTYEKLVTNCKRAYKNNDLEKAYDYWCRMYDELEYLEKEFNEDPDEWAKAHLEFQSYMNKFTNQEVYDITDYGREKYYKEKGYYD